MVNQQMDNFKNTLKSELNVEVTGVCLSSSDDPIFEVVFSGEDTNWINHVLSNHSLKSIIVGSRSFATMNRLAQPFNNVVRVEIIHNNPYTLKIQGVMGLVYSFCIFLLNLDKQKKC